MRNTRLVRASVAIGLDSVLAVALIGVAAPSTAVAQTRHNTTIVLRSDVLQRAIALEATRLARSKPIADFNILLLQPQAPQPRGWAKRHPVLLGTLVGLGVGYAAGWAIGDGSIGDWSNDMNSWVFGAVGAGVGAIVGRLVE